MLKIVYMIQLSSSRPTVPKPIKRNFDFRFTFNLRPFLADCKNFSEICNYRCNNISGILCYRTFVMRQKNVILHNMKRDLHNLYKHFHVAMYFFQLFFIFFLIKHWCGNVSCYIFKNISSKKRNYSVKHFIYVYISRNI